MSWLGTKIGELLARGWAETQPKPTPMLPEIKKIPLKADQYYQSAQTKRQIILHHTAGGSAASSIAHWASNPARIATPYVLDRDGSTYECFDPKFWSYHMGAGIKSLEQSSIGIEICSYGCLAVANQDDDKGKYKKGDAITYAGRKMDDIKIVKLPPFRPHVNPFVKNPLVNEKVTYDGTLWEAYTPAQIAALKLLLPYLLDRFKIPIQVDRNNFWEYRSPATLPSGIWSHTTVRKEKIDIFPQKEIVELVYSL